MPQVDTTASFGYWIRRQRLALDLTQAELARQVGCATVTISKIERDERRPSRQMAGLLADNLAIDEEERVRFLAAALGEKASDRMPLAAQPLDHLLSEREEHPRSNLPMPSTPFVGRRQELAQLTHHLQDPDCRLLTLVGPGGNGKTRLAIRLGEIVRDEDEFFPDGSLVVPTIAAALQFTFYEQTNQRRQLLNYLAGKRLLLILDNAEHILDRTLVDEILAQAPNVKIVVTSREGLSLQQEWFHPLGGLDVAELETADGETADAIQLFHQCARRSRPSFDLEHDLPHMQRICRLVDGAPLAIELAAAWLKALPCAQVAQELERSLDFLSTTLRNMPARHRSMRVVLEQTWSYLTSDEQRVFRQLSTFVGGFRADAAEAVASAALTTLVALVEKSVIQLRHDGRYRIHALLRQLGAEKLAAYPQELGAAQARHCEFYMAFLKDRRHAIAGRDQKAVLVEVQAELDNVRSAWLYAVRHARLEDLRSALPCLFRFLWVQGRYEDGEQLVTQALDAIDELSLMDARWPIKIELIARRAQFSVARGVHQKALLMLDDALAAAKRVGDLSGQALCFYVIGMNADHLRDAARAVENLRAAHRIFQELDDEAGAAQTALMLGYTYLALEGDLEAGQRLADEGLRLFRKIGDISQTAAALDTAAVMRFASGNFDGAEKQYREAMALAREVDHRLVLAKAIGGLGLVAWGRREWDPAIQLLQDRLDRMQDVGNQNEVNTSLNLLSGVYAHVGRYADAALLMDVHPQMWHTSLTAEALVGAERFAEVMGYLPQATAASLNARNTFDMGSYMTAWAMLLMGDCVLVRDSDSSAQLTVLAHEERRGKALEITSLLSSYALCYATTRNRAQHLMVEIQGEASAAEAGVENVHCGDHTIEELAQEMLTIRLE